MFIPLHLHSEYSFLEGGVLLEKAFKKAVENNYPSVGITDTNVLIGFPAFNILAKKNNIKPVFGMDVTIENNLFTLIIKSEEGYKNLCYLSSLLSSREISLGELKSFISGLLVIINTSSPLFENIDEEFKNKLADLAKGINPDDFYIGLEFYENDSIPHYELIRNFAYQYNYKIVANPVIRYLNKDDAIVLDILSAISSQTKIERSYKPNKSLYYFKEDAELKKFYTDAEINETEKIASSITFTFEKKRGEMLNFPLNNNEEDASIALKDKILDGLKFRNISLENHEEYRNRLNYEYLTIKKMGYCDYFLIVQDYVNFAKSHDIPVGPGRGSAAGSLVSYLLNITDVDPLKYNLLFERFLNPQRQTMPDIDIDFSDIKRDQVINYLKEKYGKDRVANILTIQTIGAKQALRDVGKIYNLSNNDISLLTKLIVEKNNQLIHLDDAYNRFPNFKKEIDGDSSFKLVFERAKLVEGLGRQRGINAAGIVLNNTPLSGSIPLINDSTGLIVQYEKDYLEDEGFLKMDILGLINLTTIDNCIKLVKEKQNIDIDIKSINLDDPKIYNLIQNGLTMGLFQLDTGAASNAMNLFKPRNFSELAAFISLDRPGPRINLPAYVRRLKGQEKVTYLDPSLKSSLEETYGIMIYQEQIMLASQAFAGFTFSKADLLRKACAKKIKSKMESLKGEFIKGALEKGHKIQVINEVYDLISRFAEYGFNKSHAVAYAMITAETGYLKAYYPTEFYASILDSQNGKNDIKFSKYVSEIKKSGVEILLPNINISEYNFSVTDDKLVMPLSSINGLVTKIILNIIEERNKNGLFKSFLDFVTRMYQTPDKITDNQISKLIDAGAFDSLYDNRQSLKKSVQEALRNAALNTSAFNTPLIDDGIKFTFKYVEADDDPALRIENEREVLGVTLSDSPLNHIKDKINGIVVTPISELKENATSNIVCLFRNVKKITTHNNKNMCFINAYDDLDDIDVTVFSDKYEECIDLINSLKKNDIILMNGKMQRNYKNNELGFVLNSIRKV